jgi:hypothetical protein
LTSNLLPDEEKAGTLLMQRLIKEAASRAESNIRILAIKGNPGDETSAAGVRG